MKHCYYGYIYQTDYQPYHRAKGTDLVDTLIKQTKSIIDSKSIIQILDSNLYVQPFDLKTLLYKKKYSNNNHDIQMVI